MLFPFFILFFLFFPFSAQYVLRREPSPWRGAPPGFRYCHFLPCARGMPRTIFSFSTFSSFPNDFLLSVISYFCDIPFLLLSSLLPSIMMGVEIDGFLDFFFSFLTFFSFLAPSRHHSTGL